MEPTETTSKSDICLPRVSRKCNDDDLQKTPSTNHDIKQENSKQAASKGDTSKPVKEITSHQK